MDTIERHHLDPRTGTGFRLEAGRVLRVIDPEGEQVSDVVAFAAADRTERLSSGRTFDYNNRIYLTTDAVLYSNRSRPMFTLLEDRVGRHDFLLTPCSPATFELLYEDEDADHPNCLENLAGGLERFGIPENAIPNAFNVFMNVDVGAAGELSIRPPRSKPGDFLDLRAEMDLLVAATACAAEKTNNGRTGPIELEIRG